MRSFEWWLTCFSFAALLWFGDSMLPTLQRLDHTPVVIVENGFDKLDQKDLDEAHILLCYQRKPCRQLAEAVYFESRGESILGQKAVAHTILNRVKAERWPNTVGGVINYRCNFSYTCDGSRKKGYREKDMHEQALIVAYEAIEGLSKDPTKGADHFIELSKVKDKPKWTRVYRKTVKIGNHTFYAST